LQIRKVKSVSYESRAFVSYDAITALAGQYAAERDRDGQFPHSAFDDLRRLGLISQLPLDASDAAIPFRVLAAIGRGDLSVGRIFEGHVNALFLIKPFGSTSQRENYQCLAAKGKIFGIWNTDLPENPVLLSGRTLRGSKNFASGADGLSHAIITASTNEGPRMIVVPIANRPVDRSWWKPLGMRASGSHIVNFDGMEIDDEWLLGGVNDYTKEPWFSAGALRFAAVHVGGMHAVLDATVTHLRSAKRLSDPYQQHRLGQMAIAVDTGYAWIERAAGFWAEIGTSRDAGAVTTANAARLAIENVALRVLESAERGVGAAGMIAPHPLERHIRDLRTYLRQPNPDRALPAVGIAVSDGSWAPGHPVREGKERG
jgi:alkylation response protein AidB-like acyl-CoA dehydrogenase